MGADASAILETGFWQAGKPGSSSFKVHLDGEPLPLAIKADVQQGWVTVMVVESDARFIGRDGLGQPRTRKLSGVVTLVVVNE